MTPEQVRAHQARLAKLRGEPVRGPDGGCGWPGSPGQSGAAAIAQDDLRKTLANLDWKPMRGAVPASVARCGNCGAPEGQPHLPECIMAAPVAPSAAFREAFGKAKDVVAEYMAGDRARRFVLSLPVPQSVNMNTHPTANGGRVLTDSHRAWRSMVALKVFDAKLPKLYGHLRVYIRINAPQMDIDNAVKPTLDALQRAGAIENDKHVDDLHIVRSTLIPLGTLDIEVGEF